MESLELGPRPAPPGRRRLLVIAVVVVVVAGLMIIVGIRNSSSGSSTPEPTQPVSSSSPPSPTTPSLPTPSRTSEVKPVPIVQQWRTDGFLSDVDLDLFARSDLYLYHIQTKKRLVTSTLTPNLQNSGSLTFVTDRRQVIVRDYGSQADGYVVPDGKPGQSLPPALKLADEVFPGPPGHLWVTTSQDRTSVTRLTDLQGKPVSNARGISQFKNVNVFQPDGSGGLLATSPGGYYELTRHGPRRLTRGAVLATGRAHLLTVDCNSSLKCTSYLINRASGEQRRLGTVRPNIDGNGTLSDDGRFAALWWWGSAGLGELRVLDLRTNKTVASYSDSDAGSDPGSLVWLPDNRLVGIRDEKIFVLNPTTGRFKIPDLKIDGLQQLSRRMKS